MVPGVAVGLALGVAVGIAVGAGDGVVGFGVAPVAGVAAGRINTKSAGDVDSERDIESIGSAFSVRSNERDRLLIHRPIPCRLRLQNFRCFVERNLHRVSLMQFQKLTMPFA
jgi:hypothetical protein